MKKLFLFPLILVFLLSGAAFASGLARPSGMGGAFIAISDDINGISINPAGICYGTGQEVGFYGNVMSNARGAGGGYMGTFEDASAWGVALLRGSYTSFAWRTAYAAYSREIFKGFALGLNVKSQAFIYPTRRGVATSSDIGLLHKVSEWFSWGFVVQDAVSTPMTYDDGSPETPRSRYLEGGFAWKLMDGGLNAALDLRRDGTVFSYQAGVEGKMTDSLVLRGGVSGSASDVSLQSLSAGLGYEVMDGQMFDIAIGRDSTTASYSWLI
ncbi:hypothetical protein ACFLZ2_02585 [Candidatus Margulisiibacteriota bacterium]